MEVKTNVRQRRQERIKAIQKNHPSNDQPESSLPEIHSSTPQDERWSDPEYVWKVRQRQWMETEARSSVPQADDRLGGHRFVPSGKAIWVKLIVSVIVFLLIGGLFKLEHPWADRGRQWVSATLTEDMPFTEFAGWYEKTFGGPPSLLPAFRGKKEEAAHNVNSPRLKHFTVPVQGKIISAFSESRPWIVVQTSGEAPVYAMDTGRVEFAGFLEDTGYTVVIRHANGLKSIYGYLKSNLWEANDWIEGGELLGQTQPAAGRWPQQLYFAVQKEEESVDPADVVSFE